MYLSNIHEVSIAIEMSMHVGINMYPVVLKEIDRSIYTVHTLSPVWYLEGDGLSLLSLQKEGVYHSIIVH